MERILRAILNFKVDEKRFEIVKDLAVRSLSDWKDNEPCDLIHNYLNHTTKDKSFIPTEILDAADGKDLRIINYECVNLNIC